MAIEISDTMNAQINTELWSAYLYLSMSMNAEKKGFKGVANWFYVQYQEELAHAKIFMNYLNATNNKVYLYPINEVPIEWNSVLDMFKHVLEHEKKVSRLIYTMTTIADEDKDYATQNLLSWFIDKQIKEENVAKEMIAAFEAIESNQYGLYMLDKELGQRKYKAPSLLSTEQ